MPLDLDTVGPVDVTIVGFQGDNFTGEIAAEMANLIEAGIIRLLDLTFIRKDADGNVEVIEVEDEILGLAFGTLLDEEFDLLSADDIEQVAQELQPATAALIVVWENAWAARLAHAMRNAGGAVVSSDRIPREVVVAAIEALEENA